MNTYDMTWFDMRNGSSTCGPSWCITAFLQGVLIPFLPEPAEFQVSRSDHKCQLFASLLQQLVDAVCQTLGKLSLLFIKNQVLSQRPRCSIGKFGTIWNLSKPIVPPNIYPKTSRMRRWASSRTSWRQASKGPCSTAPLPNYIPDMIHLQQKLDGKSDFCLWLVSFVHIFGQEGKHLSHTQVSDLFDILGHQILFIRHIPPYMALCSFQGSV